MATDKVSNAPTAAKVKSIFGPKKAPDSVIFRLLIKNKKIRKDTPIYPPYIRIPNTDIIVWTDEKTDTEGTRAIRYLPSEKSIFVDEQEKGGRVIPNTVLNNPNNRIEIIDGDIRCKPHEATKIQFLEMCNRNLDSVHRTGRTAASFCKYNSVRSDKDRLEIGKKRQQAVKLSGEISQEQYIQHVALLRIAMSDDYTNETREDDAILADYLQVASEDPKRFLDTYEKVK